MRARAAAHSLGIDDFDLTLFCGICAVFAVSFAMDAWLRAARDELEGYSLADFELELAEEENECLGG